jgi:large subunit ribosomal protein L10
MISRMSYTPSVLKMRDIKRRKIEELEQLFRTNQVIGILDLTRTKADLLHEFRKRMSGKAVIKVSKKTLAAIAAERAGRTAAKQFIDSLKNPIGLIFTNMNPFLLYIELEKNRILSYAKPNEKADIDVVIPEMNTGLTPGPILSEFGKMKIPTKIVDGMIWIAKETVAAKKGDTISPQLAGLLVKLDIRSVYRSLTIIGAIDGEIVIPAESLKIDVEKTKEELLTARQMAMGLAVAVAYPASEVVQLIIAKAFREALSLAVETSYPAPEALPSILARAERQARTLEKLTSS